jgi:hypothetical protein
LGESAEAGEKNVNSAMAYAARIGRRMAWVWTILRVLQSNRIVFDQGETQRTIERETKNKRQK